MKIFLKNLSRLILCLSFIFLCLGSVKSLNYVSILEMSSSFEEANKVWDLEVYRSSLEYSDQRIDKVFEELESKYKECNALFNLVPPCARPLNKLMYSFGDLLGKYFKTVKADDKVGVEIIAKYIGMDPLKLKELMVKNNYPMISIKRFHELYDYKRIPRVSIPKLRSSGSLFGIELFFNN